MFAEDLRREILRSACNEVVLLNLIHAAAEAEINNFDETIFVDEYVFRFETRWE